MNIRGSPACQRHGGIPRSLFIFGFGALPCSSIFSAREQSRRAGGARIAVTAREKHPKLWTQQDSGELQQLQAWSKESPKGRFKIQEHLSLVQVIRGSDDGWSEVGCRLPEPFLAHHDA